MGITEYLPQKIRREAEKYMPCGLEEIRVRAGKPVEYIFSDHSLRGVCTGRKDIEEMINYLSDYSFHAITQQLLAGFFTVEGGHRVGIAGQTGCDKKGITSVTDIASLNIRIARQIKGVSMPVIPYIRDGDSIHNTFIISRPGNGKTTLLRDCIRILSDGADGKRRLKAAVVDERSEIGACYRGVAQNDLGASADILDNCPKAYGMRMLLRSMSPDVIAVDELGGADDLCAVNEIINCGIHILGTVHAGSAEELKSKKLPKGIERFVFIDRDEKGERRYSIYDKNYRLLHCAYGDGRNDKCVEMQEKTGDTAVVGF